jgi:purine-binding chemotaxis protein CheW
VDTPRDGDVDAQESAGWRCLAFRLGSDEVLVAADAVAEVLDPPEPLTRVPSAPAWIVGVAAVHGVITLVADLSRLLGVTDAGAGRRLLLARGPDSAPVGLLVTEVIGTRPLPAELQAAATDETPDRNPALRTLTVPGGGACRILDVPALLRSEAFRAAQA